ncbi:Undecaprenol kinase [Rubripirellula lacrimiformis]|uniref:Undecaprenol kinase n=1 Tax=Rubripirellula lacrimiformis TaxID=1930273 RepID=A0A517N3N2_9BACT|nr:diacylglycerol kinase [Rubripirellula lacrimiformis]QDT01743.1 Undecaprenol kinase [Rubripirellula lacrimiformis]
MIDDPGPGSHPSPDQDSCQVEPRPSGSAWARKFAFALAGLIYAVRSQNSFWIHLPIAVAVIAVAAWLQVEAWRWCMLVVATGMVIAAELVNTSIEMIVKVLHPDHDVRIGHALDAAAAAVLVTAIGAVTVGLITLGPPLYQWMSD